jgi:hypothetical protein
MSWRRCWALHRHRHLEGIGRAYNARLCGGCSSVGRVPDCDSGRRGFESHQPPHRHARVIRPFGAFFAGAGRCGCVRRTCDQVQIESHCMALAGAAPATRRTCCPRTRSAWAHAAIEGADPADPQSRASRAGGARRRNGDGPRGAHHLLACGRWGTNRDRYIDMRDRTQRGQVAAVGEVTPRQLLQRPRPRRRGSGLPSPVLKLAWHRMHTYIFELDIMGLTPGSALGRAAVYSAWVWRSLTPFEAAEVGEARRVAIDRRGGGAWEDSKPRIVL